MTTPPQQPGWPGQDGGQQGPWSAQPQPPGPGQGQPDPWSAQPQQSSQPPQFSGPQQGQWPQQPAQYQGQGVPQPQPGQPQQNGDAQPQWGGQQPIGQPAQGWGREWGQQGQWPALQPGQRPGGIRGALGTTRGKVIAGIVGVAVILAVIAVVLVVTRVLGGDEEQTFDLGDGVHITVAVPDGWRIDTVVDDSGETTVAMQPEDSSLSVSELKSFDLNPGNLPSSDFSVVAFHVAECSEFDADTMERQMSASRRGAWMITEAVPQKVDDSFRVRMRLASRTAESCSGSTVAVAGIEGRVDGEAGTVATELVSDIVDGKIIKSVEIR